MSLAPEPPPVARPDVLLRVPVGLASPLWGIFAGAAMGASAWWWMTRWARPENLEAMFGAAAAPEALPEPATVSASEPVPEAVTEPRTLAAPVGDEAAPVSPVLAADAPEPAPVEMSASEAPAEPKPRVKKAEPKAD